MAYIKRLKLLKNTSIRGITIFPFIFIRRAEDYTNKRLINHEKIHIRQQAELLVLPFYLFYLLNYLSNLWKYKEHHRAYREIIFEREAYRNDDNLEYLENRKFLNFLKYLK